MNNRNEFRPSADLLRQHDKAVSRGRPKAVDTATPARVEPVRVTPKPEPVAKATSFSADDPRSRGQMARVFENGVCIMQNGEWLAGHEPDGADKAADDDDLTHDAAFDQRARAIRRLRELRAVHKS